MSLHLLVLVITILCISSHMQSVQSQFNPFLHSKWGFGACPKVTPMKDVELKKLQGLKWNMIAHYSDGSLLDRHCSSTTFGDANPGSDVCRLSVERVSTEYDDGEHRVAEFFLLLPNETDYSTWINTYRNNPVKSYIIDTDYDKYILNHECREFPRDNPIIYEQHNYISSTQAVWKGGLKDFQKELGIYEGMGIDTGPFVLHNQDDCKSTPEIPEPLE